MSSQAASISAWNTVFDWPSMVAAFTVARQVVASSSAAFKKMAARSSHAQLDHSRCACLAAAIACSTCSGEALCQSAST
jgi:negative regulator of sigma E activity